jgi:hypothetical protein
VTEEKSMEGRHPQRAAFDTLKFETLLLHVESKAHATFLYQLPMVVCSGSI